LEKGREEEEESRKDGLKKRRGKCLDGGSEEVSGIGTGIKAMSISARGMDHQSYRPGLLECFLETYSGQGGLILFGNVFEVSESQFGPIPAPKQWKEPQIECT
jgi:hypothetical protein